jgi:hypothetical protein
MRHKFSRRHKRPMASDEFVKRMFTYLGQEKSKHIYDLAIEQLSKGEILADYAQWVRIYLEMF